MLPPNPRVFTLSLTYISYSSLLGATHISGKQIKWSNRYQSTPGLYEAVASFPGNCRRLFYSLSQHWAGRVRAWEPASGVSFCSNCTSVNTIIAGLGLWLSPLIIISYSAFSPRWTTPSSSPHRGLWYKFQTSRSLPPVARQLRAYAGSRDLI